MPRSQHLQLGVSSLLGAVLLLFSIGFVLIRTKDRTVGSGHHVLHFFTRLKSPGTDLETQRLPNALTIPGAIAGVAFNLWVAPGLIASLIGLAFGAFVLLAVRWVWERLKGVEGMGLGDVKMLALIGAFLGWTQVWVVLFFASLAGAIVGIGLAASGRGSMKSRLPFGAFLAVAAFASSLIGERLVAWYLSFYQ